MRTYINATDEAKIAVAEIVRLVKSGECEPLVGYDTETSPARGLVGYPGTTFDAEGEKIKKSKKMYLEFVQARFFESFHPGSLRVLGLHLPRKLTTGNEAKGVPVKAAWMNFWATLQQVSDHDLEASRWKDKHEIAAWYSELDDLRTEQLQQLDALQNPPMQKNGKPGKPSAQKIKAMETEIAWTIYQMDRVDPALDQLDAPLDVKMLRHIVACAVEGRMKVDPVQPGLDPFTSEVFLAQFTLRRVRDGQLLSWIFNVQKTGGAVLVPALNIKGAKYLGANIKFDVKMTHQHIGLMSKNVYCVSRASRMLYLGLKMGHSLADCTKRFAGIELSKEVRNTFVGQRYDDATPEQLQYAYTDTEVLFPVYDAQMKRAEECGQVELVTNFCLLSHLTARWELRGWRIDAEKWMDIYADVARQRDEVAREVEAMLLPEGYLETFGAAMADEQAEEEEEAGDSEEEDEKDNRPNAVIRLSQGALVLGRLEEMLGPKVWQAVFDGGKPSIGKDARGAMESVYIEAYGKPHPFFGKYKLWSKLNKQANTYGKKFLWAQHPLTGRIHASFHIAGTDTGRYSSTGPNLLNIPTVKNEDDADFRAAFLAPEGYWFGNADYSAMEQRIAADLTLDPTLIEVFVQDGDSHSVTAAFSFHLKKVAGLKEPRLTTTKFVYGTETKTISVLEVPASWGPKDLLPFIINDRSLLDIDGKPASLCEVIEKVYKKTTRSTAKTVGFLFYFGGSAFGMAKKNNLPVDQCEEFFELFGGTYPVLVEKFEEFGERPFENAFEGDNGSWFGYAEAYGGLRRYFRLPDNPSRHNYPAGWQGEMLFKKHQKEFWKQRNKIRREAKNVGTQGGNAVVTCEALLMLDQMGERYGIEPALAIYDELLVLVPDRFVERYGEERANALIEQAMVVPSEKYIKAVPSKAEANPLSKVWAKF